MSNDPDLEALKQEVDFNTPVRGLTEEDVLGGNLYIHEDSDEDNFTKITQSKKKSVSINDPSATTEATLDNAKLKSDFTSLSDEFEEDNKSEASEPGEWPDIIKKDSKKYRLLCITDPKLMCGGVMGQGTTFCANYKCTIKHRTKEEINLKRGQLFVLKSCEKKKAVAFKSPTIDSERVEDSLVEQWLQMNHTLHSWSRIFRAVRSTLTKEAIVTEEQLMTEKHEIKKAREYKTPSKVKSEQKFVKSELQYSPFQADPNEPPEQSSARFMQHIEDNFSRIFDELHRLQQNQDQLETILYDNSTSFDLRLSELREDCGDKPQFLESSFDAPDLWSTIAEIVTSISAFSAANKRGDFLPKEKGVKLIDKSQRLIKQDLNRSLHSMRLQGKAVKEALSSVTRSLKNQIVSNTSSIQSLLNKH